MKKQTAMYIYGDDANDKYPYVKLSIETITPETAEKMLGVNLRNRSMKREPIAKALQQGLWMLNGAAIVFDENGVLLDGQNRLDACVKTRIPFDTVVARGIDHRAQMTMDVGVKRSLSDYLTMDGYKNATKVAAIGAAMWKADNSGIDVHYRCGGREDQVTLIELYNYTTSVYESRIEPIIHHATAIASQFSSQSGVIGPLFDVLYRIDVEDFEEFAKQIRGQKTQCQPVQVLVKKLNENVDKSSNRNTLKPRMIVAYIIKTWNAYMQGEELPFLRFTLGGAHPEKFPKIYGADEIDEH